MVSKPYQKEDPVWSILPSYDMYQNTFNGGIDPPQYHEEASVQESVSSISQFSSEISTDATTASSYENVSDSNADDTLSSNSIPSLIVADESTQTWRETILDNIHNLRNYSSSDNPYTQNVELSVHFTEDVGKKGVAPQHVDPSQFEYKQGDYLNGYIYIKNKCSVPIPFDMFYVLFEGNFIVGERGFTSKKKQVKIKKYLQMYDFAASWNQSRVDRLLSETHEEHHVSFSSLDPQDGSYLGIVGRILKPGVLYKRFFTFKIPERLLDTECDHNLPNHTMLPPTLGLSEKEKVSMGNIHQNSNDFSFLDTATNYGVLARFIGKASNFKVNDKFDLSTKLIDAKGDEFIIFRECTSYVRVIQETNLLSHAEKHVNSETSRLLYENFLGRIKEKLELGTKIKEILATGGTVQDITSVDHLIGDRSDPAYEDHKARQLYTRFDNTFKGVRHKNVKPQNYEISLPLTKKKLLGSVKCLGMIQISSPKVDYLLNYMSPKRFKSVSVNNSHLWKLEVPINISFLPSQPSTASGAPYISKIVPELVVFTMKAGNHPIPIEITHEHLFRNHSCKIVDYQSSDNFENIVKKPMKRYASEIHGLVKEVGQESFKVEKSLLDDICALGAAETKENRLDLRESKLVQNDGITKSLEDQPPIEMDQKDGLFSTQFTVLVDATKAQKKGPKLEKLPPNYSSVDEFCLVPSFQNCNLARMYYLRFIIKISTGDMVELKLPLTIAKIPTN